MKQKQCAILGIDISSSSIKIIQLSPLLKDTHCVEGYGVLALPDNAIDGAIVKDIDAVADTIKKVVSTAGLTSKQVALAVPDASVISKVIQISEGLSEADIEELVMIEADKYIPYPIDEINIDFNVIGPSAKNAALQDVLIVASRTENVNTRVEAVRRAGLEVKVVDVESYAVERAAQQLIAELPDEGVNKIVAIIDIGAIYSHLFVLHNMKIIYTRDEAFGGKQLIESIAHHYNMGITAAREALEQGKLPDDFVSEVLTPLNETFFLQVKRTLQFFFSTSQYSFVHHIVLVGGGARQPGIAQLLEEHIGVPTTIGNPINKMKLSNTVNPEKIHQVAPSLMIACGLALRDIG